MNFLFMAPQIWIAKHYKRDFDMIFLNHVKAAQNFAAQLYGIDFDRIFLSHYSCLKLGYGAL